MSSFLLFVKLKWCLTDKTHLFFSNSNTDWELSLYKRLPSAIIKLQHGNNRNRSTKSDIWMFPLCGDALKTTTQQRVDMYAWNHAHKRKEFTYRKAAAEEKKTRQSKGKSQNALHISVTSYQKYSKICQNQLNRMRNSWHTKKHSDYLNATYH